ncbi:MAG: proline--tRNA ligase [Bacteroidia bacterium]
MRLTRLLSTTLRQDPAESLPDALRLLMRAGYLRAGSWLPPGRLGLDRLAMHMTDLLRQYGGTPLQLPLNHAPDPRYGYGCYLPAAHEDACFAPQHPALLALARSEIASYRQLPLVVYQQRRVYWPLRPGYLSGGSRDLLEVWVLAADPAGAADLLAALTADYARLLAGWQLPLQSLAAEGDIIGSRSGSVWVLPDAGGDLAVGWLDGQCQALSLYQPAILPVETIAQPLTQVHTPGIKTIKDLADFLGIAASHIAKAVIYTARCAGRGEPEGIMLMIRGDLEVDEVALRRDLQAWELRPATSDEIHAMGAVPGFASPIGLDPQHLRILADESVVRTPYLAAGANQPDQHWLGTCYGRDYTAHQTGHWALDTRPRVERMHAVGGCADAGTLLSEGLRTTYMDEQGRPAPLAWGYLWWDLGALYAAAAAVHQDEAGLCWPAALSPHAVALVSLADDADVVAQAEALYQTLVHLGVPVLYDDRPKKLAGPGVKFKDADLRGIPLRLIVARRGEGRIEWKARNSSEVESLTADAVLARVREWMVAHDRR